jgi:hypothetical protein
MVHQEGPGGLENSWGHNILPIILGLSSSAPATINDDIQAGKFTTMLSMVQLGAGTTYNPIVTRLYGGANLGMAPKFDGTDVWPIDPSTLTNPTDPTSATVQFPMSYVNDNTWVSGASGSGGTVTLPLALSGTTFALRIAVTRIELTIDPTHRTGTHGIISGVINTQQEIAALQAVAGSFDSAFCNPNNPTFQSIATQISQASDILSNGTQDPTMACTGISIGLGFNAALVQLGPVASPTPPAPNPCADAGAG